MAAYAMTLTIKNYNTGRLPGGVGILIGNCNVTNYNSTGVEIKGISKAFRTIWSVIAGTSDNGHLFMWNGTEFDCYYFDYDGASDGAAIEVANDVDAGQCDFVAFGSI